MLDISERERKHELSGIKAAKSASSFNYVIDNMKMNKYQPDLQQQILEERVSIFYKTRVIYAVNHRPEKFNQKCTGPK